MSKNFKIALWIVLGLAVIAGGLIFYFNSKASADVLGYNRMGYISGKVYNANTQQPVLAKIVVTKANTGQVVGVVNSSIAGGYYLPLPYGIYDFKAEASGYAPAYRHDVKIATTKLSISFTLKPMPVGVLAGQAKWADGTAIKGAKVVAYNNSLGYRYETYTDSYGKINITNVKVATYDVRLTTVEYPVQTSIQHGIIVKVGSTATVSFTLKGVDKGSISGTIKFTDGTTVPYAQVEVWDTAGRGFYRSITTTTGTFSIKDIPVGIYNVKAKKLGGVITSYPQIVVRHDVRVLTNTNTPLALSIRK